MANGVNFSESPGEASLNVGEIMRLGHLIETPGRRLLLSLACLAILAGCVTKLESSHLGPSRAIKSSIEQFYRRHASEQLGRCSRPFIDAITKVDVIEDTPERWVADIRYKYQDRLRDEDTNSNRKICRGFASRIFTLEARGDDFVVAEMSGQACHGGVFFSLNRGLGLEKRKRTCP